MDVNLLSPSEKKEVRLLRMYFLIKTLGFRFTSLVVMVGVVLTFGLLLLRNENNSLAAQIASEQLLKQQGRITSLEEATSQLNTTLQRAELIQGSYISWTHIMSIVSNEIPDGITVTTIQLNDTTNVFQLSGTALNRQSLLDFEESIKEQPLFQDIALPVSNLTIRENIPFEMTGVLTSVLYE